MVFCHVIINLIHVIINLSKPTECTIPRVNPDVKYGLSVLMMCQCRFISCSQCTTVVQHVDTRGGRAYVGQGIYANSICSTQFFCELKTALKIQSIKNKQQTNSLPSSYVGPSWPYLINPPQPRSYF